MAGKKKPSPKAKKNDRDLIRSAENLRIDKEKRYQRTILGPQVENQTTLKETKKKAQPRVKIKKKSH